MDAGIDKIKAAKDSIPPSPVTPETPEREPPATPRDSVVNQKAVDRYNIQDTPEPQASSDTPATAPAPSPIIKSQSRENAEREQSGEFTKQYPFVPPKSAPESVTPEPATAAAKMKKAVAKTRRGSSAIQQVSDALTLDTDAKSNRLSVSQMRKAIDAKDALNNLNR